MLLTDRYGAPVGYLTIGMLETQLRTLLGGTAGAQNELLLLDARWRPVYCTQPAQTQSLADALRGQLLSGKALTGLSADVSYTVRQHTETGLYLVLQQPQPLSAGTLRLLYSVSVLCALACIILSVVLSLQLSRQVFQPIGRLHHAIRQVGKNNLDVQVPVPAGRHDELGELAQQFNTMVVALRHNQQALLENQRALNRAQIRMLQAQLNPHFLCNTLDTMKWISKINQVPQVALMSTNLADILRFCITPDEFVPLRRELEILSRYVEIQRIRLSESFSYTEAVPEALLSCMVPKMLLQPLAENAILHGLSGVEHGELSVTAVLAEQDVLEIRVREHFEIRDDKRRLAVLRDGKGLFAVGGFADHDAVQRRPVYCHDDTLADHFLILYNHYPHHTPGPPFAGRRARIQAPPPSGFSRRRPNASP